MTDTKTLQQVRTIVGFKGSENLEACRPKPGPPLPIPNRHTLCHGNSPESPVRSQSVPFALLVRVRASSFTI